MSTGVHNQPVQNHVPVQQSPDQQLQQLQTQTANRSFTGKVVSFLRNIGLVKTDSQTTVAFRNAMTQKLGGAGADIIFREMGIHSNKSLSSTQAQTAINLANKVEAGLQSPLFGHLGQQSFLSGLTDAWATMKANGVSHSDPRVVNLNADEIVAINEYTTNSFKSFQDDLRTGNPTAKSLAHEVALNSGLAKLPNYQGQVHRGCSLPRRVDAQYQNNAVVQDLGFISTSASKDEAFRGCHEIVINSQHGKDISFLSNKPWEKEVLFASNTPFRVLSRQGDPFVIDTQYTAVNNGVAGSVQLILQDQ